MDSLRLSLTILSVGLLIALATALPIILPKSKSARIITYEEAAGKLTCYVSEKLVSCLPTWWLVPQWTPYEEAVLMYEGIMNGK